MRWHGVRKMRALAIFLETPHDEAGFAEYRSRVLPTIDAFGGRFLVRGGHFTCIEGRWPQKRIAILEFPSRSAAEGWYASDAYRAIIDLRLQSVFSDAVIVDALD